VAFQRETPILFSIVAILYCYITYLIVQMESRWLFSTVQLYRQLLKTLSQLCYIVFSRRKRNFHNKFALHILYNNIIVTIIVIGMYFIKP